MGDRAGKGCWHHGISGCIVVAAADAAATTAYRFWDPSGGLRHYGTSSREPFDTVGAPFVAPGVTRCDAPNAKAPVTPKRAGAF